MRITHTVPTVHRGVGLRGVPTHQNAVDPIAATWLSLGGTSWAGRRRTCVEAAGNAWRRHHEGMS